MPTSPASPFTTGSDAAEQVAADPFWSVVRRRHPDIDVVVLPAEAAVGPAAVEVEARPEVEPASEAARVEAHAVALWTSLVGGEPTEVRSRWTSGRAPATSRVETTLRLDDADPTGGVAAVGRGAESLEQDGWHVLAPPDGLPRVLAGRGDGLAHEELQLVLAPAESRLVLRLRSADVRLAPAPGGPGTSEGEQA
ncbi:hypothetical protein [Nocardioides sp. Arc9.136]|uniref:hypothetical protein n=1 Tax=Nocardioides sp. Arc9.136 TaxID=2996826 RepID=UPI0026671BF0|nr:hypothetical protein [Nocardioides sp. Arc9.136]WKN48383.1 hypothetical protein OSR43_20440 [Nocardioides sp. Arc9.136]